MKKIAKAFAAAALCASMALAGCSGDKPAQDTASAQNGEASASAPAKHDEFTFVSSTEQGNSGDVKLEKGDTYAVISVKDFGDIKIKLFPDLAPYAVYNFTELAKRGDYNGRNLHRLIEGFMIQGGSGNGIGYGGDSFDGGEFKNEINTSLRHYYGALCYAATSMGDITDGFYIVNNKAPQTDFTEIYDGNTRYYQSGVTAFEEYLSELTEDMAEYADAKAYYESMLEYCRGVSDATQAMKDTTTDAVTSTYAEKGGTPSLDGGYTVFGQTVEGFDVIDKITAVEKVMGDDGAVSKPVNEIIIDKIEIFTME